MRFNRVQKSRHTNTPAFSSLCTSETEMPNCCSRRLLRNRLPWAKHCLIVLLRAPGESAIPWDDWLHWLARIIGPRGVHVLAEMLLASQTPPKAGEPRGGSEREILSYCLRIKEFIPEGSKFNDLPRLHTKQPKPSLPSKELQFLQSTSRPDASNYIFFFSTSHHLLRNTCACLDWSQLQIELHSSPQTKK